MRERSGQLLILELLDSFGESTNHVPRELLAADSDQVLGDDGFVAVVELDIDGLGFGGSELPELSERNVTPVLVAIALFVADVTHFVASRADGRDVRELFEVGFRPLILETSFVDGKVDEGSEEAQSGTALGEVFTDDVYFVGV
jgi:hypothetical protein